MSGRNPPLYCTHIIRHARGRENIIFPVQLTTSRIGNLTRLIHTLLYVMTLHTYIHTSIATQGHQTKQGQIKQRKIYDKPELNLNASRLNRPSEHPPFRFRGMLCLTFGVLVVVVVVVSHIQRIGCQPTRKKLLYTVANPARSWSAEQGKKEKEKVWQRSLPPPARCSFGENK